MQAGPEENKKEKKEEGPLKVTLSWQTHNLT